MANKICGYPFIYNKIPSEVYNASLVFIDEDYNKRPSGSSVELITDSIRRNARVVFLDAKQEPPLEFGIEVVFDEPTDIFVFTQLKDWLCGELSFKQLQICAENFNTYYYNCYIQAEEDLIFNGGYTGIRCKVICDAPWAWELESYEEYILNVDSETEIDFNNLSADSEMLRPKIEINMAKNGDFSITNTNTNKTTTFKNLQAGETITLDNLYGFITSSTGMLRVGNFNKVFLKLAKGYNKLICSPNANSIKIHYQNARRMGGGFY